MPIERHHLIKFKQVIARKLFGIKPVATNSTILISFPKSGRTWLRVMLDAAALNIDYTHDFSGHRGHRHFNELEQDKSVYKDRRVILMVRDPRDVVVSSYFHATKRIDVYSGTISEFIRDPEHGIEKIIIFNSTWMASADIPKSFCMIQYEDMHQDLPKVLTRIFHFVDPGRPIPKLNNIIEFGRFENMKQNESSGKLAKRYGSALRPGDTSDPESFKCRKGQVGGYGDYLSEEDISYCEQILQKYNYMELLKKTELAESKPIV